VVLVGRGFELEVEVQHLLFVCADEMDAWAPATTVMPCQVASIVQPRAHMRTRDTSDTNSGSL
jgi:hypothetical protein